MTWIEWADFVINTYNKYKYNKCLKYVYIAIIINRSFCVGNVRLIYKKIEINKH